MPREAAGIDSDPRTQRKMFANMIPGGHTTNAIIFYKRLLYGMAHPQRRPGSDSPSGEVLVQPAHIDNTGNRRSIAQGNLSMGRDKIYLLDWMVEMLGNVQRHHIADPAAAAGMDGIANFMLAFENQRSRTLLSCGFTGS